MGLHHSLFQYDLCAPELLSTMLQEILCIISRQNTLLTHKLKTSNAYLVDDHFRKTEI